MYVAPAGTRRLIVEFEAKGFLFSRGSGDIRRHVFGVWDTDGLHDDPVGKDLSGYTLRLYDRNQPPEGTFYPGAWRLRYISKATSDIDGDGPPSGDNKKGPYTWDRNKWYKFKFECFPTALNWFLDSGNGYVKPATYRQVTFPDQNRNHRYIYIGGQHRAEMACMADITYRNIRLTSDVSGAWGPVQQGAGGGADMVSLVEDPATHLVTNPATSTLSSSEAGSGGEIGSGGDAATTGTVRIKDSGATVGYTRPPNATSGTRTFYYKMRSLEGDDTARVVVALAAASAADSASDGTGSLAAAYPPQGHISGLLWCSGGARDLDGLRDEARRNPATGEVRKLDIVGLYLNRGSWNMMMSGLPVGGAREAYTTYVHNRGAYADIPFPLFPGGPAAGEIVRTWPGTPEGLTRDMHISSTFPVGYDPRASREINRLRALEVWAKAGQGWFDHYWLDICKGIEADAGSRTHTMVFRVGPGMNEMWNPGDTGYIEAYSVACVQEPSELVLIQEAWARAAAVIKNHFPNALVAISCLRQGRTKLNIVDHFDPRHFDLLGCDYYDRYCPHGDSHWSGGDDAWINTRLVNGSPQGLAAWRDDAKRLGKLLYLGEVGIDATSEGGGGDNPVWITGLYRWLRANAADVFGEVYFNGIGAGDHRLTPGTLHPGSTAAYNAQLRPY
jgi:hypothetical protein